MRAFRKSWGNENQEAFIKDLELAFGIFEEKIDLKKLRKEWDRKRVRQ